MGNYIFPNFGRKSNFWSKIYLLVENRSFGRKSKFWPKIEIIGRKSKCWSKIELLVENWNFGRKSNFWPKIELLVQNRNFGRKSNILSKIEIMVKNRPFCENHIFGQKFWFLVKNIVSKIFSKLFLSSIKRAFRQTGNFLTDSSKSRIRTKYLLNSVAMFSFLTQLTIFSIDQKFWQKTSKFTISS